MERTAANNDVVLVTGASTGLGLALAKRLLTTSYRLILTARASSVSRFAMAGIAESERLWIRPLDVTRDAERRCVIREADEDWGGVDVLVNNAGIAYRSVVEHFTERDDLEELQVNFIAPMALIQLVLPHMRAQRRGRIINVSSVSGMMAMPTMALYSASKFALEGACESLWYEVRPWGINVSLVEPGFIHSDSFKRTRYTPESKRAMADETDPYHIHYKHMAGFIARLMERTTVTPESVAARILKVMRQRNPPLRVPAGNDAHFFNFLRRLLPRRLYHYILYTALPGIRTWGKNPPTRSGAQTVPRDPAAKWAE
ncbi:MAG: SDR family oxidoreductase [Verrucomicrobiales bacterium]|nr:SDR family oxidoreductase [Verrucomicrobiales bacterium]